ncbi:NADH-ubiquinone oxidoreductase-F iron-sulfur binding region domain-containing protein [Leptolyngbya sp. 7M]|uniref:NADH-ubiquinone oxidoreductase-F iron-sulfur binding region domain-containing protein n=1 Tax=Leptolyngbya sp. 7M TaxID=2812896 RepID=UPI001B8C7BAD|nr:NADH-ubiquinone oxidoreductase-F iron-sulfur binding region domain-containing protein [Leptolyngbya sp. 7M]QYO65256.1 SLBB domain-containing protein [Leptolyngbya sp. 7M]
MLVIRDAQIQSFIASNDDEVALLVAQAQIRMNPARVDGIRPARLRAMAKIAVEKARLFGLEKAEDVSGFASLMFEISPLFYEQKEIKAALTDTAYPIDIRLQTLFQRTDDAAWTQAVDRYEPGIWFGEGSAESAVSEEGNEPPSKDHIELTLLQVQTGGTKLWSVSGHVKKPGVYELPMGYADMEKFIMEDCGGMLREDKKLKAVIPGGSSVYIMNAGQILEKGVTLDYEGLVEAGSMLGTGGMIVMDETVDIMESTKNLTEFYKHESCGWCTPCREGTDWLVKIFNRISIGGGRPSDAQLLLDICDNIEGKSFCPLGDAAAWPIQSAIKQFPGDFKKWLVKKASGEHLNN